jgi:uncharacterized membrane protein YqjE
MAWKSKHIVCLCFLDFLKTRMELAVIEFDYEQYTLN